MHTHIRLALTSLLLACTAVSSPALAQASKWYAGFGLGMSTAKDACDGIGGPGVTCDDEDTAFKILGGYQVNPNFAVEFGYTDLGKAQATAAGLGTLSAEVSGIEVLAVGMAPINPKWSLYGKLGFFNWDLDFKDSTGLVGNFSESGTELTYGFGANYDVNPRTAVRIEYQLYSDVGEENTTGTTDVSVLGAALLFRF